MNRDNNKIYISNSPFINGHKIIDFIWNAHLDENLNLWMDLHLESDKYDEEEEYKDDLEEIDDISEENAEKQLWINYDHCVISSTYWNNKGIKIPETEVSDFIKLNNKTFIIDPLPIEIENNQNLSFGVSMLGKDTIAQNEITFLDTNEFGIFDIKWKGKIANTYLGESDFDYDFYVYMKNIKFEGINVHPKLTREEVINFIKSNNLNDFELIITDESTLEKYIIKLKK
ncbi:hypothetical protein [Chishuiella sp.]|uniref:hypothetical protein n=1 Tax=Chishuiella sp. TaxID=1969467 RepID=UPI0028AD64FF|nr:hypothetical protein [Chishuiella sp.]